MRSLGPVWSRPNAFGHGVPFRFPASPDTGPGLTDAGRALVRRCAELGIVVDLSHLNAAGLRRRRAPGGGARRRLAHARATRCAPPTRNLTDDQLREIGRSDGLVGIVFAPPSCAPTAPTTPTRRSPTSWPTCATRRRSSASITWALGSDFDGAPMPAELGDVAGLPRLLDALRDDGFSADEVEGIAWGNWRRVLAAAWGA